MGISALSLALSSGPAHASSAHAQASVSVNDFAGEASTSRIGLDLNWKDEATLYEGSKRSLFEVRLLSFYETGDKGDRSIDLDPLVWRKPLQQLSSDSGSYFWLGRTLPLTEGLDGFQVSNTSAVGANWVQNQSNALSPRVSGWLGAGFHQKIAKVLDGTLHLNLAMTPIFLPTFGPSVALSETEAPKGPRFSRYPPTYANINNQLVPLRYRIDIEDLSKIVLQPQLYFGTTYQTQATDLHLRAWTAPSPNPEVDASGVVKIVPDDVNVLVTAKPRFPREYFLSSGVSLKDIPARPDLDVVYEARTTRLALSAQLHPATFLDFGGLHTFTRPAESSTVPESPSYAKHLVWAEVHAVLMRERVKPAFRVEQHLTPGREGTWLHPSVDYQADKHLLLFADLSLISGKDLSYFGNWRSLDSFGMGARLVW